MKLIMASMLVVAFAVTVAAGEPGMSWVKFSGIILAFVTVMPVFNMLYNAMRKGNSDAVMKIFAGGFVFKLTVLLVGTWYCVSIEKMNLTEFVAASLSFVFALQICEALFFYNRRAA